MGKIYLFCHCFVLSREETKGYGKVTVEGLGWRLPGQEGREVVYRVPLIMGYCMQDCWQSCETGS